jgi:hypothetical protein
LYFSASLILLSALSTVINANSSLLPAPIFLFYFVHQGAPAQSLAAVGGTGGSPWTDQAYAGAGPITAVNIWVDGPGRTIDAYVAEQLVDFIGPIMLRSEQLLLCILVRILLCIHYLAIYSVRYMTSLHTTFSPIANGFLFHLKS